MTFTVLIVKDVALLQLNAMDVAEQAGIEPATVGNAAAAISILGSRDDIRIVFTDINTPVSMNALKLASIASFALAKCCPQHAQLQAIVTKARLRGLAGEHSANFFYLASVRSPFRTKSPQHSSISRPALQA